MNIPVLGAPQGPCIYTKMAMRYLVIDLYCSATYSLRLCLFFQSLLLFPLSFTVASQSTLDLGLFSPFFPFLFEVLTSRDKFH